MRPFGRGTHDVEDSPADLHGCDETTLTPNPASEGTDRLLWTALLVALALAALVAGCDNTGRSPASTTSASKRAGEMTFTRKNFALLVTHPDRYQGARVDIVGRVVVVERDGSVWRFGCTPIA